jgi:hypothetical protein
MQTKLHHPRVQASARVQLCERCHPFYLNVVTCLCRDANTKNEKNALRLYEQIMAFISQVVSGQTSELEAILGTAGDLQLSDVFVTAAKAALQRLEKGDRTTELQTVRISEAIFTLASDPAHNQV